MKRFRSTTVTALAALCFFMTACSEQTPTAEKTTPERAKVENLATTPGDIRKEAGDLAKTTMTYTEEQKALYQKKIQDKMGQYSQNLKELQEKLAMMNEQAKADMAAEMEELKRKKAEMGEKARELQATGSEAYGDIRKGLDSAIDEMDKAYDEAMKRFRK